MELLQHSVREELNNSLDVYKPTTTPFSNDTKIQPLITTKPENENIRFRPPSRDPIDLQFRDISYTAMMGFLKKEPKEILHGINGRFPPKQLIAIMGPSGAGKSTLLDILSGYRITGVTGNVYTNGRLRDLNEFRKMSCYITQDDRLQPLLTVQENMRSAANLKLGVQMHQYEKDAIIEEILTTLGLNKTINTLTNRLSGGQKKRLSIALELINNPLVMFLDEPTTGLDSSSCHQCLSLLQLLARQGRTIVCTIHQPSATLFQMFDLVYILSAGECLYQGSALNLVPYLQAINIPCPMYHNPADYVIELACGEYGNDKIRTMATASSNGLTYDWFTKDKPLPDMETLRTENPLVPIQSTTKVTQETSFTNQLKVLIHRGFLKSKRDATLTHLRILVNIVTGLMLGVLYLHSGDEGSRVLDNYNLLFAILMHQMMSPMMLTILTFPQEMSILQKEHFNRWYSLTSYYISVTLVDIPISFFCCLLFSIIIYWMSAQPMEIIRFAMFFVISMLVVFVAQSFGLMIGAVCNVVNGTFLGPTLNVPQMMFAGFGVTLRDLPSYLRWCSYLSYLRYGLEGLVGAIYGLDRPTLDCAEKYCHYRYPAKFLSDISMRGDQFWFDVTALCVILVTLRIVAFYLLRWKLMSVR